MGKQGNFCVGYDFFFTTIFDHFCQTQMPQCASEAKKEILEESSWFEQEQDTFYEFIDLSIVNELQSLIQEAIDELPPSYRQAFTMHRFQNKTRQEIAEVLQVSIKTVDYRILQSLKILRERLKDYLPILAIYGFIL